MPHLTPIEKCIYEKLSDGEKHKKAELEECIDDPEFTNSLANHIYNIKKKLRREGIDIAHRADGWSWGYQMVRLLNHAKEE